MAVPQLVGKMEGAIAGLIAGDEAGFRLGEGIAARLAAGSDVDGQTPRVQKPEHLSPRRAGSHRQGPTLLIDGQVSDSAHVDRQPVLGEGLPTHGMAGPRGRHLEIFARSECKYSSQLPDAVGTDDPRDRRVAS